MKAIKFINKVSKWQTYLLPSLTGRGWGVGLLLLLFAACSSGGDDDDINNGNGNGNGSTTVKYTVTSVSSAPSWAVDWQSNEARPDWQEPDPANYENWAVMLVQIEDALMPYASDDDLMALFVDGECRGLAEPAIKVGDTGANPNNEFILKAFGNEADQKLLDVTLKYYNHNLKQVFSRSVQIKYNLGEIYGVDTDLIPQFTLGASKYPVVMTLNLTAVSTESAAIQPAVGDLVGAFVGDECRGVYTIGNGLLTAGAAMTVYGREAGESVTMKYYSAAAQQVYTFSNTVKIAAGTQTWALNP